MISVKAQARGIRNLHFGFLFSFLMGGATLGALLILANVGFNALQASRWRKYSRNHNCTEISRRSNPQITAHHQVGRVWMRTWQDQPDTVTYRCDGGVIVQADPLEHVVTHFMPIPGEPK